MHFKEENLNNIYYYFYSSKNYFNCAFGYNPQDCFIRNHKLYIGYTVIMRNSGAHKTEKFYATCLKDLIKYLDDSYHIMSYNIVEIIYRGQVRKYSVEKIIEYSTVKYVLVPMSENLNKNYKEN